MIDESGWLLGAQRVLSPNFNERPVAGDVSLLVIHNISLPPDCFGGPYIRQLFTNCLRPDDHPYFAGIAERKVSAHVLLERDGGVVQFVSFAARAWHAGVSQYGGRVNCNDFSIGIELEGTDTTPYTEVQYQVLSELLRALMAAYPALTPARIVGHCDIAPGRKTDPGPAFDWGRVRALLRASAPVIPASNKVSGTLAKRE